MNNHPAHLSPHSGPADDVSLNIINNITNAVIISNSDHSIRYVNKAFEKLTGFHLAEIAGACPPYPWWPADKRTDYLAEMDSFYAGKLPGTKRRYKTKSRSGFWVKSVNISHPDKGNSRFFITTWTEITELRRSKKAFHGILDRQHTNQMLMLEEILHRLRNPLTSIKGYISALMQNDAHWDPGTAMEFVKGADREADRLENTIRNLITLSQLESKNLVLNKQVYTIAELFSNAGSKFRDLTANHELIIKMSARLPKVLIDEILIIQAISNLVENAAKYAPAGSKITLKARAKSFGVEISVTDEGPGIPIDDASQFFEKYTKPHKNNPGSPIRSGISLMICRGIIEAHGGMIKVNSRPGWGSNFHFHLPANRKA
jgi:PAS domain S-box-containing protein